VETASSDIKRNQWGLNQLPCSVLGFINLAASRQSENKIQNLWLAVSEIIFYRVILAREVIRSGVLVER
jgi:hypothetical protein